MRPLALLLTLCAAALAQTAPRIVSFRAEQATIQRGASTTLTWQVEGAASVSISGIGAVGSSGSRAVSPVSTTQYTLRAVNFSAEVFATVTVSVEIALPRIISFRASPGTVSQGGTSVLSWEVADATAIQITPLAPGTIVEFSPRAGSLPVSPRITTTYTLTAVNLYGSATASVTVTYGAAAPDIQTVTPAMLHFLDVPVGTTKARTVALNSIPFFTDVRLTISPEGGPFKLETPATTYSNAVVTVSFSPQQSGSYEADLRILWAPFKLTTVRLYGSGVDATSPGIFGIANSADSTEILTGDSHYAIYGQNLSLTTRSAPGADSLNNFVPTSLDGVSVEVNGKPAFVTYVSPSQVNILTTPEFAPPETSTLVITNGNGKTNDVQLPATRAISLFSGQRDRQNYVIAIREDGTYAAPEGLLGPTIALTPVAAGERISLSLTGLGPEPNPALQDGQHGSALITGIPPSITLTTKNGPFGEWTFPPADAHRAGPGSYIFDMRVPDLAPGEYKVRCDYNNATTIADYTLLIGPKPN